MNGSILLVNVGKYTVCRMDAMPHGYGKFSIFIYVQGCILVRVLSDFIPQLKCLYEYKQAFASTYNSDRDLEGSEVVEVAILYFVSWFLWAHVGWIAKWSDLDATHPGRWRTALGQWVENWELFDWQQQIRSEALATFKHTVSFGPTLASNSAVSVPENFVAGSFLAALAAGKTSGTNPTLKRTFCQTKNVGTYTVRPMECYGGYVANLVFSYMSLFKARVSAPVNQQPVTTCMRRLFFGGGNLPKLMEVWGPWP